MRIYYRILRIAAQFFFVVIFRGRLFGLRNIPRTGGVLLISNHQSFLDPVLVTLGPPREGNYMARDTLFRGSFFKRLIESLNAFPIRRATADLGALKELMRRLKGGRMVVAFPEGTRTEDGSIGPFLEGAFVAAQRVGCVIVPVVVEGAFEAWPRKQKLPSAKPIHVEYGRPMSTANVEPAALAAACRAEMVTIQARLRARRQRA